MANRYLTLAERFWLKVKKPAVAGAPACWTWIGTKGSKGYGRIRDGNVQRQASRVAYELFNGPLSEDLTIDHVCRNHGCVNPAHLEAVPNRENVRRGIGPSAVNARKMMCPKGHTYDEKNTRISKRGGRYCRACGRERYARNFAANPEKERARWRAKTARG